MREPQIGSPQRLISCPDGSRLSNRKTLWWIGRYALVQSLASDDQDSEGEIGEDDEHAFKMDTSSVVDDIWNTYVMEIAPSVQCSQANSFLGLGFI